MHCPVGAAAGESPRLRVACVGDSLTRGDGLHEHPPNHRVPTPRLQPHQRPLRDRGSYPAMLRRLLGEQRFDVRNFGHGGATACNETGAHGPPFATSREFYAALRFEPHVVVLMLGTNDAKRHFWHSFACGHGGPGLRRGMAHIVDTFRALPSPPRLVLILQPPPLLDADIAIFGIESELLAEVRAVLADEVAIGHLSSIHSSPRVVLAPPLSVPSDARLFTSDGLHLSGNGSALLACEVHSELRRHGVVRCARLRAQRRGLSRRASARPRSCWDPFCPQPETPEDEAAAAGVLDSVQYSWRACMDESGIGAPLLFTGMACTHAGRVVDPGAPAGSSDAERAGPLNAVAQAACRRLRQDAFDGAEALGRRLPSPAPPPPPRRRAHLLLPPPAPLPPPEPADERRGPLGLDSATGAAHGDLAFLEGGARGAGGLLAAQRTAAVDSAGGGTVSPRGAQSLYIGAAIVLAAWLVRRASRGHHRGPR